LTNNRKRSCAAFFEPWIGIQLEQLPRIIMLKQAFLRKRVPSRCFCLFWLGLHVIGANVRAETSPEYYAVEASASVQVSPPQITLNWSADWNATGYTIFRKAKD